MAHLGRFYKVQFRRDLHLDFPNYEGYPECFNIALANLGTPYGVMSFADRFLCSNLLKNNQPPMVWTSNLTSVLGQMWRLTWSIANPAINLVGFVDSHYTLEHQGSGVVLDYTVHMQLANYGIFILNADLGSGTLAAGYSWSNFFNTVDAAAAPWSIYP